MLPNFLVLAGCALIPFLVASIWFHPKVFGGDRWRDVARIRTEDFTRPVKPLGLVASVLLNLLLAFGLFLVTNHQTHVLALTGPDLTALQSGSGAAFMAEYGSNFLSSAHGLRHAALMLFPFFVLPILGYAVIFERKGWSYLLVNGGFWLISVALMGLVIGQWGGVAVT